MLQVTLPEFSADKDDKQRCSAAEIKCHKNQGCKRRCCCCCLLVHVGNQDTLICFSFFHILINYMALFRMLVFSDAKIDFVSIKKGFDFRRNKTNGVVLDYLAK